MDTASTESAATELPLRSTETRITRDIRLIENIGTADCYLEAAKSMF